ncbi:hypothetical protein BH23CHL8_BH23CHL8_00220 [soil metagenome]
MIGPASGWTGGARDIGSEGHAARGGHAARDRRDLLLPALHALQARVGWISQAGLNHVCRRLTVPPAEAYGVATFYALFSTRPRPAAVAHVCDDIACRLAGAEDICAEMERRLGAEGDGWSRSPCLGLCERAPAAYVTLAGEAPRAFSLAPADPTSVAAALAGAATAAALDGDPATSIPQLGQPSLRLLARAGRVDPGSLEDHLAHGGSVALRRAIALGPTGVIAELTASGLVGRGGAAFPTGRKWAAVAGQPARPH